MVLIMWGRLPSGMWAAWAGSQDSGHLDPTGGRRGALHPEVYKPRKNKSCTANVHKVPATPRAPPSDKHPYEQASSWLPRHRLTPRSPESLTSSGA